MLYKYTHILTGCLERVTQIVLFQVGVGSPGVVVSGCNWWWVEDAWIGEVRKEGLVVLYIHRYIDNR